MIGFRCECGAAIDCTYPKCNAGDEVSSKDITERLRDYASDYTTTTYHDDLIREAVTEIESMRQQLAASQQALSKVCEEWSGIDGMPQPEDEVGWYLFQLVEKMRDAAMEGLK